MDFQSIALPTELSVQVRKSPFVWAKRGFVNVRRSLTGASPAAGPRAHDGHGAAQSAAASEPIKTAAISQLDRAEHLHDQEGEKCGEGHISSGEALEL